jgi:hypothetical protein
MAEVADDTESISGIMMPAAPLSSSALINDAFTEGVRTSAGKLRPLAAWQSCVAVSNE